MSKEANLYLTDKTGRRSFNTTCTYGYHQGEQRNLERHLDNAIAGLYKFLDPATVRLVVVVDGEEIAQHTAIEPSDIDLLNELLGD